MAAVAMFLILPKRPLTEVAGTSKVLEQQEIEKYNDNGWQGSTVRVGVAPELGSSATLAELLNRLFFVRPAAARAAKEVVRNHALSLMDARDLVREAMSMLRKDCVAQSPRLTNHVHSAFALLSVGAEDVGFGGECGDYLTLASTQEHHIGLQRALADAIEDVALWRNLLESWRSLTEKQFEERLRELFVSSSEAVTAMACRLLVATLKERARGRAKVLMDVMLELGDPQAFAPHLASIFGDVQSLEGGGVSDNMCLSMAHSLAQRLVRVDAGGDSAWAEHVLLSAVGSAEDYGSDMFVALVAAESRDNPRALPTLQRLLARCSSEHFRDMILTNLGRVTDADTVVVVAAQNGVSLASFPRTEAEAAMQASLVAALLNVLERRPQDAETFAREVQPVFAHWLRHPRHLLHLEFLLTDLVSRPKVASLRGSIQELTYCGVQRIEHAANAVLSAWEQ